MMTVDPDALEGIKKAFIQRQTLLTFEITLQNQIKAKRREMTRPPGTPKWTNEQAEASLKSDPELMFDLETWETGHLIAIKYHRSVRRQVEIAITKAVMQLPCWPWVESVRGFGALGLGQIVGSCGDLHNYSNPAKVWRRMGVGVLEDGTRQRRIAGVSGEEALAIGYSPARRSIMWNIGSSLLKGNRGGYYKTVYDAEKAKQLAKLPDPFLILSKKTGQLVNGRAMLADMRAQRYMEKRLLRDLWRQWRLAEGMDPGQEWREEVAS
jgi:hypothetical protein